MIRIMIKIILYLCKVSIIFLLINAKAFAQESKCSFVKNGKDAKICVNLEYSNHIKASNKARKNLTQKLIKVAIQRHGQYNRADFGDNYFDQVYERPGDLEWKGKVEISAYKTESIIKTYSCYIDYRDGKGYQLAGCKGSVMFAGKC